MIKHLHMKGLMLKEIKTELVHSTSALAFAISIYFLVIDNWVNLNVVVHPCDVFRSGRPIEVTTQKSLTKSTILF